MRRIRAVALAGTSVLAIAGCGAGSLSADQLRASAAQICRTTALRTRRIPTPRAPSGEAGFLHAGAGDLRYELSALQALHASPGLSPAYRHALRGMSSELRAIEETTRDLGRGEDAQIALRTLQSQLAPIERRQVGAWAAVGSPSCAGG
ncbi:MAG: hypothetical protein ACYC91_14510 [Solirubrobacteraceae bacterium]